MAAVRRRVRSTEVVYVSTFAIIVLFGLYSLGRSFSRDPSDITPLNLFRRDSEPDLEVSSKTSCSRDTC